MSPRCRLRPVREKVGAAPGWLLPVTYRRDDGECGAPKPESQNVRMAGIEQAKAEIRFALSQLAAQNRHHEFEHLTRALARMTVSSNILPATGPVAGSGDQGRDFETYRTELPGQVQPLGRKLGIHGSDGVGFCCTLQQKDVASKFADDVAAVLSRGTEVRFVVAYCEANVKTAVRHAFQDRMRARHGIHVEMFDGNAIAELMAQPHTFWIAEEYLHLPARVFPPVPDRPGWYEEDLARWHSDDSRPFSWGHLVDLTGCLRYAAFHEDAKRDLPFWIGKMEQLLGDDVPSPVRSKAQYEIAVAYLRGLGDMRPADHLVAAFIGDALTATEPSALLDAAVLVNYCIGATARRLTAHADAQIMGWNTGLTQRVKELLAENPTPGRECALLDALAALKLQPDLHAIRASGVKYELGAQLPRFGTPEWQTAAEHGRAQPLDLPIVDAPGGLDALTRLTGRLGEAPLFPVDSIADTLTLLAHQLVDDPRYDVIVTALDQRTAEIEGGQAAGERARDRAMTFLRAGRLLESLREIHRTRSGWFSGEASRGLILATLMTAEIYGRLKLHAAAKYYALAAAALVPEDHLDLYPRCLFRAAEADYHQGAWFSATQLYQKAFTAHGLMAERPFDLGKHADLSRALFGLGVIQATAVKGGPPYEGFISRSLEEVGATDLLREGLASLPEPPWWDALPLEELADRTLDQLGRPTFADAGALRSVKWSALGTCWTIEFANSYADTLVAERLAAAAQVVLADLALRDPALLPTQVTIEVTAGAAGTEMDLGTTADSAASWQARLPQLSAPGKDAVNRLASEAIAVTLAAVREISVLPHDAFDHMLDGALEADLMSHVVCGVAFDTAYAGVIDAEMFADAHRSECVPLRDDGRCPQSGPGMEFPSRPGPGYSPERGREQARFRYERLPSLLQSTLPVLRADDRFRETVRSLRSEGWPDWQILLSVFNVAKNARLDPITPPRTREEQRRLRERFLQPEPPGDPIPAEIFTAQRLRDTTAITLSSALVNHWHLALRQNPVDQAALRRLLAERYMYGQDDAPHEDLFGA